MVTATSLKYSENKVIEPAAGKIIAATAIPVEVFVIFLTAMHQAFTVSELIKIFYVRNKIELSFPRMQQISNDLVLAGKVKTYQARNKKNNLVNYYLFNTIL